MTNKFGWEINNFESCLEKVSYPNKINSNKYLHTGTYPIVSQDENLICGFWNEKSDVLKIPKSVVVFGDHTRVLKYIDFDFVVGADGVRVLLPKSFMKSKFLYYYLKWVNVPSLGYSRHYKLLKELNLPVPPLPIQQQIVSELDALSEIMSKKKQQIEELDKLAQATFYDMFGDPVTNEKGWEVKKMGEITKVGTGGTPSRKRESEYYNGSINWAKTTEVNGSYIYDTEENITELALTESNCKIYSIGTILLAMYGQGKTRGNVGFLKINAATNQACAAIPPTKEINQLFLFELLKHSYLFIRSLARGGNQENLNLSLVSSIKIILPPLQLQNRFSTKIESIESQKVLINHSIDDVQQLFDYTMGKYFN